MTDMRINRLRHRFGLSEAHAPKFLMGGCLMKSDVNPMQSAHAAPRCTAHSKRSGFLCKNPAVRGWAVCRMHGASGGASCGAAHPQYRHGLRSRQMRGTRAMYSQFGTGKVSV